MHRPNINTSHQATQFLITPRTLTHKWSGARFLHVTPTAHKGFPRHRDPASVLLFSDNAFPQASLPGHRCEFTLTPHIP